MILHSIRKIRKGSDRSQNSFELYLNKFDTINLTIEISTGFLYDHTFSWGSMVLFNGSYQDTLQNSKTNWLQLHLDLERAKVNDNAEISNYQLKDSIAKNLMETTGNIPLMVLNVNYNAIKPFAIDYVCA